MMVCHDDRHPQTLPQSDLISRRNSVITSNDRINPFFVRFLDQLCIQSVSVFHTIRNITVHIAAESPYSF